MTPEFQPYAATAFTAAQGSHILRAFAVVTAAWLPWPESIGALSRLAAGPRSEQERLAAAFWARVFAADEDGAAEILDDLQFRPWIHMPWTAEEFH